MSTVLFLVPQRPAPASTNRAACSSPAVPRTCCPWVRPPAPDERTPLALPAWRTPPGFHRRSTARVASANERTGQPLLICCPARHRLAATGPGCGLPPPWCAKTLPPLYEQAEVAALRAAGLQVRTVWQAACCHRRACLGR